MTTYTHQPTGITVTARDDGMLHLANLPTSPGTLLGSQTECLIGPNATAAIHAAYFDALGLWLDEETGYLVSTTPSPGGNYLIFAVRGPVIETALRHPEYDSEEYDDFQQALARYLATVTPPPTPQPGEEWVLMLDIGGRTAEATVVEHDGETLFVFCDKSGVLTVDPVSRWHRSNIRRVES